MGAAKGLVKQAAEVEAEAKVTGPKVGTATAASAAAEGTVKPAWWAAARGCEGADWDCR